MLLIKRSLSLSTASKRYVQCGLFMCFFLGFSIWHTQAQDFFPEQTDFGIRFGADYEIPGNHLRDNYNANTSYNLGLLKFSDRLTWGINMSYRRFDPKQAVVVTEISPVQQTTDTYSSYSTFLLYVSIAYNRHLGDRVTAYGGINLGGAYTSSGYAYSDNTTNFYFDGGGKQTYFAPRLGLSYALTNYVDLDFHAAYNMFIQGALSYNSRTGFDGGAPTTYSSVTAGAGIVYKF